MALLELKNIIKKFDGETVVNDVSIKVNDGEFFTLLGPSGCGKTTLLRMIAGFERPNQGQILLAGQDISHLAPEKRPLHTVFQSYALFPHLNIFNNIAFSLKMLKWQHDKITIQVNEMLEIVQLSKYAKRHPHELSGGQKQRVAIARALVDKPQLLLLDEPLSALDAMLREHMHSELIKLQKEVGVTFIYVTHDQNEALALSDRVGVMNKGVVEQLGTPAELYSKPKTYFVADFIGKCNLLKCKIIAKLETTVSLEFNQQISFNAECDPQLMLQLEINDYINYAIRPEKIKVTRSIEFEHQSEVILSGIATNYFYYGDTTLYEILITGNYKMQVLLPNNRVIDAKFFKENEVVTVYFDPRGGNLVINNINP